MNKQETINVVDFNNMFFSNQTEDNSRDEFNVETFFADEDLERVFEFYDRKPREQKTLTKKDMRPSRSYHEGRIYGSGHYGNEEKEERYQAWVKNFDLVQSSIYEYKNQPEVSIDEKPAWDLPRPFDFKDIDDALEARLDFPTSMYSYMYDTIRFPDLELDYDEEEIVESDDDDEEIVEPRVVMRIVARPTPLEEGEIVEDDVYPNDLLEPEPFIRAPVISYEAAEIMANEFSDTYLGTNRMEELEEKFTLWDIQDQEREDYEEMLINMAEEAEREYDW